MSDLIQELAELKSKLSEGGSITRVSQLSGVSRAAIVGIRDGVYDNPGIRTVRQIQDALQQIEARKTACNHLTECPVAVALLPKCETVFQIKTNPCVYLLSNSGQIVYVGMSRSGALARVASHNAAGYAFDEVFCVPVSLRWIEALERALIGLWEPKHNTQLYAPQTTEGAMAVVEAATACPPLAVS